MATRLVITLDPSERLALGRFAQQEMRDPRDQIRFIVRERLLAEGLLDGQPENEQILKDQSDDDTRNR